MLVLGWFAQRSDTGEFGGASAFARDWVQPGWGAGEGTAFESLPPHRRYRRTAVISDELDQQRHCTGGFPFSVCVVLVLRIDSPRISMR